MALELAALPEPGQLELASARVDKLLQRLDHRERLLVQQMRRNSFLALALLGLPGLAVAIAVSIPDAGIGWPIAAGLFLTLVSTGFVNARNSAREIEAAIQQTDHELNLLSIQPSGSERAGLLYLKQQFELKRYYDEALRQSRKLSYVGAGCCLGGVTASGVTLALLLASNHGSSAAGVALAAVVGAGAILAYVVAAIFLQMHLSTVRALAEFQGRLVDTNHLHFRNMLLARIDDGHAQSVASFTAVMTRAGTSEPRS